MILFLPPSGLNSFLFHYKTDWILEHISKHAIFEHFLKLGKWQKPAGTGWYTELKLNDVFFWSRYLMDDFDGIIEHY